jgi:hypothetical protein
MGESYRIKTELGSNKTINVQLDQEFEFLEILSLKIQQADIYTRSCADYGVVVGRVTANNGLGIPNARVAVFVPITNVDESNPLISSIYPYQSPSDKNEDGYRYNLLPYEKSYSKHSATGTLPTRADSLTGITAVEIYDTYYRYTAKTNESGDYMIMGVPLGDQAIVMDVDLSDIGEFSLTPQDLIRMGLATEAQVAGSKFRTSTDLNSLPQIVNLVKNVEISPLWGDASICQIAINRLDFDLRDDANVDIQPTSVFMGSMFSSPDNLRVKYNGFPKDNMGNLCGLTTSPGQILALRQTIRQDSDGNPVLEQYELEQSGNVIDGSGTWLIELPMNLDYFVTNEFGEKVLSNDPTVGIPTKAKYRFKVKWTQPNDLTLETRRAYYLVPNVKEYGWTGDASDPTNYRKSNNTAQKNLYNQQQSSYYFGLAWSGYTNGFTSQNKINRLNEIIDCEDTFYEFQFNKVYTVSSLIDQYKSGRNFIGSAPGRFIGIKEIDSQDCEDSVNKFPVNDGFRNFDLLFFLFSIIFTVIQPIGLILLGVAHILMWLYNVIAIVLCAISKLGFSIVAISWWPFRFLAKYCNERDFTIRLPMITYPDCQACDCKQSTGTRPINNANVDTSTVTGSGVLSYVSSPQYYYDGLASTYFSADTENQSILSTLYSESFAGLSLTSNLNNPGRYKLPFSQQLNISNGEGRFVTSFELPVGERINIFNLRESYFSNINKIKVTFAKDSNIGKHHYDNTITVLSQEQFAAGELITFINITGTTDINYLYSATTTGGTITGISGETYNGSGATTIDVSYATTQVSNIVTPVRYNLPYGSTETNYKFPADVEYYQVITAITVSQASQIWNTGTTQSFGNVLNSLTRSTRWRKSGGRWVDEDRNDYNAFDYFENAQDQYILVLQRGVDPYSPKYINEYSLGNLFGTTEFDPNWTVTASTRVNIPIQKLENSSTSVQGYNQNEMFYQSYFFKPGTTTSPVAGQSFSGFNTTNTAYYSSLDASTNPLPAGATTQGLAPNNPGTLGSAKRITRSGFSATSDVAGCNAPYSNTDNLFVPNIPPNATPRLNLRMYNDYDSLFGYSNPFNGFNRWFKMNWGGVFYSVKVNPSGFITGFISCVSLVDLPKVLSMSTNGFYSLNAASVRYDSSEDLSGGAVMSVSRNGFDGTLASDYVKDLSYYYTTKTFFSRSGGTIFNPTFNTIMLIDNDQQNVLRTDRLPSSDRLDGGSWTLNPSLLQQNVHFGFYVINTDSEDISSTGFETGAQTVTADLTGLPNAIKVLESFDCQAMVGLSCYQGFGDNFSVNQDCTTKDAVDKGCYMFLRRPLTDLVKDWGNFGEWGYRFRFFYGLCRGVLSQSFMNNWINGALYSFPIQVTTYYNNKNKPEYPRFPSEVVYFNMDSNNFYYRSSPWNDSTNKFIGKRATDTGTVNSLNLLYPTTIINLGMKDYFYSEITFDPSTKGYILPNINPTSYGDTSDLINLFVISRITDEGFLKQLISAKDNGIDQLFSRPQKRIDGDLAQLLSINSEVGNINFSPEFYEIFDGAINPTTILGSSKEPIMAVWFSSTTQDLQTKDYLTPGRIDFRGSDNVGYYPYPYGIKSQLVPFYQWKLASGSNTIFGNQANTWATQSADIIQNNYQSLDRTGTSTKYYLNGTSVANDLTARGYIYSVDGNIVSYPTVGGRYTSTPQTSNRFLVGAPYQFYFGVVKGQSALDRFKTKYSLDEN